MSHEKISFPVSNGRVAIGDFVMWSVENRYTWRRHGDQPTGFLGTSYMRIGRVTRILSNQYNDSLIVQPVKDPSDSYRYSYEYPRRLSRKSNIVKVDYDKNAGTVSFNV